MIPSDMPSRSQQVDRILDQLRDCDQETQTEVAAALKQRKPESMAEYNQRDADSAAAFFGNCMNHVHRGLFDCGDKIVFYGNDGYANGASVEVDFLKAKLLTLGISNAVVGLASGGYSWALIVYNYQRVPYHLATLEQMLWDSLDDGIPQASLSGGKPPDTFLALPGKENN